MPNRTLLIDGDILAYRVTAAAETPIDWGNDLWTLHADMSDCRDNLDRQIAMYLIRNMTETSLKAVGVILGGKDHSTIKHGIEKIENELKADETLSNTINIIKKKINPA